MKEYAFQYAIDKGIILDEEDFGTKDPVKYCLDNNILIDGKDPKEYVADKITELNTNQQDKEPISKALESPAKHQEVSELNKSEKTEPSIPKPAILKRIINKLTFGLAFSSEINEYKAEQKLQKVQDKKSEITSNSQEPTPISKDKAKFVKKTITPGIKQSAIVIASKVQRTRETQPAIQPTVKKSNDRTRGTGHPIV